MIRLGIGVAYELHRYETKEYIVSLHDFPEVEVTIEMRSFDDGGYIVVYNMTAFDQPFASGLTPLLDTIEEAWDRAELLINIELENHMPTIRKYRMKKNQIINVTFSEI